MWLGNFVRKFEMFVSLFSAMSKIDYYCSYAISYDIILTWFFAILNSFNFFSLFISEGFEEIVSFVIFSISIEEKLHKTVGNSLNLVY